LQASCSVIFTVFQRQLLEDEIQKRHDALKEEMKKRKEAKNV
jgi:hypothetical protein